VVFSPKNPTASAGIDPVILGTRVLQTNRTMSSGRNALIAIALLFLYVKFERPVRISSCVINGETVV
jgi:hypothetical protein